MKLLLENRANSNLGGGEQMDAFMGTPQTPLMLAKRRGETAILAALTAAGATNGTPDRVRVQTPPARELPAELKLSDFRTAIAAAIPPLQETSIKSKEAFVRHESRQDCTSCHQQHLPMAALGYAKKQHVAVDAAAEQKLIKMVLEGELKNSEVDWEPVFHPDAVFTKGYEAFAAAAQDLPANESADSWVHHLATIQGKDGQWYTTCHGRRSRQGISAPPHWQFMRCNTTHSRAGRMSSPNKSNMQGSGSGLRNLKIPKAGSINCSDWRGLANRRANYSRWRRPWSPNSAAMADGRSCPDWK